MFVKPPSFAEALGPGSAGPSLAIPYANPLDQAPGVRLQQPQDGGATFAVDPAALGANKTHTQYVSP